MPPFAAHRHQASFMEHAQVLGNRAEADGMDRV
jgi:hypothetical protein